MCVLGILGLHEQTAASDDATRQSRCLTMWRRRHAHTSRILAPVVCITACPSLAVSNSRLLTFSMDHFSYVRWTFFPHHWKFDGPIFCGPIFLVDVFTVAVFSADHFSMDVFSVDVFTEYREFQAIGLASVWSKTDPLFHKVVISTVILQSTKMSNIKKYTSAPLA